jgi:hypothetical protein
MANDGRAEFFALPVCCSVRPFCRAHRFADTLNAKNLLRADDSVNGELGAGQYYRRHQSILSRDAAFRSDSAARQQKIIGSLTPPAVWEPSPPKKRIEEAQAGRQIASLPRYEQQVLASPPFPARSLRACALLYFLEPLSQWQFV